jgi:hypothetical protein
MIPEKVFEKFLVLGEGWRVQRVDYLEKESKVLIRIEETAGAVAGPDLPTLSKQSCGLLRPRAGRWRHLAPSQRVPVAVRDFPDNPKGCYAVPLQNQLPTGSA